MRLKIEEFIKQLAISSLPQPVLYKLWHLRRRGRPRTGDDNAMDIRMIHVQSGVRLEVYWNTNPLGPGPSASLYVLDEEVLRVDCFGGKTGHMHINPVQVNLPLKWEITPQYFFPPGSKEDHIERAIFELTTNTLAALQTNQLARIRKFHIEKKNLTEASLQMKKYMNELLIRYEGT